MKKIKKAFTLVELMVVIAIIAVLAAVSIVGYTSFIDREKERSAITEATQAREIITAEVIKAKDGIIAEGVIAKDGKISISINDPSGTVILSYENGELHVRTETGIIRNESKKADGFDAMLRKAFPSLAPLPGFFSVDGSIISYHSDYDNESENIIVDVITGDLLKQKDKDSDSGSSSGEESGSETPSSSDRVRAVFEQSFLPIAPGTPYTISYETSGPEGTVSSLITSGESIEPVDGEIPTGAGTITINAISEGTSYIYLIATDGKNKAEAKLTVTVDKDAKIPVALPKQLNTITYDGKVHGDDVKWDIPPGAMIVEGKTETGSEPKRYSATFALIDTNKYCWAFDGSDGEKQVEWVLSKKPLSTPFQVGKLTTTSGSADVDTGDGFIANIFDLVANKIINSLDKSSIINALAVDKYPTWDTGDWSKLEKDKEYTIENQKGRTVGEYTATFTLIGTAVDHYYWEENENSASIKAKWSINRTQVPIPTINAEKENGVYILGYKEGGVEPDLNLDDGLKSIIDVSGDTKGSEVGKVYEIKLDLKTMLDSYTDCFEWKDGTTTTKTLRWKITKMYFDDPKLVGGPYTYTGGNITPQWADDDKYSYEVESSKLDVLGWFDKTVTIVEKKNDKGKDVGDYTTKFTLKDTKNYGWKSTTSDTVSVTWNISKANGKLTVSKKDITLKDLGKNSDISLSNYTDINKLTVKSSNTDYVTASINASSKKLELNVVKQDDLQHTVTITITDPGDKNYNEASKQVIVTVNKAKSNSPLELSAYAITLDKGTDSSISIKNSSGATLTVESEDSNYVTAKVNKGKVEITVKKQDSKQKQVKLTVNDPGNDTYSKGSKEIIVTINPGNKKRLTLDIDQSEITIKKNNNVKINITDCSSVWNVSVDSSDKNNVSVTKNSKIITITAKNPNKTETITINDKGNDDYDKTTITITVKTTN